MSGEMTAIPVGRGIGPGSVIHRPVAWLRTDMMKLEERLRTDMTSVEERLRTDMTSVEERLRANMTSVEERYGLT